MDEGLKNWLDSGCPDSEAAALYLRIGNNEAFKRRLRKSPSSCIRRTRYLLLLMSGADASVYSGTARQMSRDRFRSMYPFLSDRNIPDELKTLATDKMTTYWRTVELHDRLYSCNTNAECAECAAELLSTFMEDQSIKEELDFYKVNGKILGKHPIFHRNAAMDAIRKMNLRQLLAKERQLRGNIWRVKDEMKKKDRPWLDKERQERLQTYEKELEMVENLLKDEEERRK